MKNKFCSIRNVTLATKGSSNALSTVGYATGLQFDEKFAKICLLLCNMQ